jgi:hypothetical protein
MGLWGWPNHPLGVAKPNFFFFAPGFGHPQPALGGGFGHPMAELGWPATPIEKMGWPNHPTFFLNLIYFLNINNILLLYIKWNTGIFKAFDESKC